ncbi:putative Agenet-like domain-containing protein [Rosa chinensis]|uniref:Putative Agenet-like domain-containing protein n=1 Tax=Rosa chinensis TaxID=74649 RepID=A0A2P6SPR1_ROSCH|nr:protein AGENET DOMAIN (AGD)-CONTAINING P1 isoform X1 [Rosa chinensis]PRQ60646.1 putative Agenet-like domain-containing protein [Rosa chinensis]
MAADDSSEFQIGTYVEVTSPVHSMRGSLFPAKIVAASADRAKFTVEYDRFKTKLYRNVTGKRSLRDEFHVALLRPPQPREEGYAFKRNDAVDAFMAGGWWEGVITEELGGARFEVFFRFVKQRVEFEADELRLHREWVRGAWVPPLREEEGDVSNTKDEKAQMKEEIGEGTEVEVSNDEDGFQGSWFAASVVQVVGKDRFLIQYKSLKTDDGKEFLTEEIDAQHIRPCPPETVMVDCYSMNEEVEAYWNDGWWEGKICKVLLGGRYKVYFEGTNDKMVFDHSDLRPRQVWIDRTWVMASQALMQ